GRRRAARGRRSAAGSWSAWGRGRVTRPHGGSCRGWPPGPSPASRSRRRAWPGRGARGPATAGGPPPGRRADRRPRPARRRAGPHARGVLAGAGVGQDGRRGAVKVPPHSRPVEAVDLDVQLEVLAQLLDLDAVPLEELRGLAELGREEVRVGPGDGEGRLAPG